MDNEEAFSATFRRLLIYHSAALCLNQQENIPMPSGDNDSTLFVFQDKRMGMQLQYGDLMEYTRLFFLRLYTNNYFWAHRQVIFFWLGFKQAEREIFPTITGIFFGI